MRSELPAATLRTEITMPLQLTDGFATVGRVYTFEGLVDGREHLAIRLGDIYPGKLKAPLVRLHSECLTGDVLGSQRCDCGPQLNEAIRRITAAGGYLLYLRQEGRGIGLYNKMDAYKLQDAGLDTYQANHALGHGADERDYTVAAQMLMSLGIVELSLLSNNPDKATQLATAGLTITERVSTGVHLSAANRSYLDAKARHGAHDLAIELAPTTPSGAA
ncbi:GTP cyclohydrolase II [Nocardioides sp. Root614]|uniref:GTP cyclohydrolase II n=2 Tax=unclassified Nocardioides TaxID=2615069 RepID=UPI0006FE964B|nr:MULTISPECIES: GTP cyclohydrolase II [unclassified Nocardioides]KRA31033.1 GTP cyclohydrolase [Nocardioides sp. Root614]KRA87654.1 GTP cyclohydrolase [Nocardioides sp. Root682]